MVRVQVESFSLCLPNPPGSTERHFLGNPLGAGEEYGLSGEKGEVRFRG